MIKEQKFSVVKYNNEIIDVIAVSDDAAYDEVSHRIDEKYLFKKHEYDLYKAKDDDEYGVSYSYYDGKGIWFLPCAEVRYMKLVLEKTKLDKLFQHEIIIKNIEF